MKKYLFLLATVFMCAIPWSNALADDVTYTKGERILGVSGVTDGAYVIIEVGSTSRYKDYYIKDNHNNQFRWQKGFDQGCIWQVESTGTTSQYYFKNVETGLYMGGNSHRDAILVSKDNANKITLLAKDEPATWHGYNDQDGYPKTWDENSIALKFTTPSGSTGYYGNNESGSSNGLFDNDASNCHNVQWNFYTAVPAAVTYETSLTDGKYYYIISNFSNFGGVTGTQAMCYSTANTEAPYWGAFDDTNNKFIFKLVKAEGDNNWYIQNAYNEKYFTATANAGTLSYSTEATTAYNIIYKGDNLFTLRKTGDTYYIYPGYCETTNTTATISSDSYGTEDKAAVKWLFRAVSEDNINAITTAKTTAINALQTEVGRYEGTDNLVFGMSTENYNTASEEVGNITTVTPSLETLDNYSVDKYVNNLTTGYYRIANVIGFSSNDLYNISSLDDARYLTIKADQSMVAVEKATAQTDLSNIFYIQVDDESSTNTTMQSQGLALQAQDGTTKIGTFGSQKVEILPFSSTDNTTRGIASIRMTEPDGRYTGNYYLTVGKDDYTAGRWHTIYYNESSLKFYITPVKDVPITMHAVGNNSYATLCAPFGLTIKSEGLTAYTAVLNTNKNYLLLTELGSSIPGGTPVILIGSKDSSSYHLYIDTNSKYATTPSSDYTLQGQYLGNINTTDELSLGYVTNDANEKVVGFYKYSGTIGANKARIPASAVSSKGFTFSFGDDDPTGINSATTSGAVLKVGDIIYDLQGRRVQDAKHGIYIINGKKTVVK